MAEIDIPDLECLAAGLGAGAGEGSTVAAGPCSGIPCPSTIVDGVRDSPPPPVGEDRHGASPRAQPLCASASPREPDAPPPPAPLPDRFTPERRARFLAALAELGSARAACARVGISAQAVYLLRRRDALFAAAWEAALVLARQVAEDVLAERALDGVEEPVFYRGEQIGSRWRFDARLLLAHLARLDARTDPARGAGQAGAARAARFDELLALVGGAVPPAELAPPVPADTRAASLAEDWTPAQRRPDPLLPPDRAGHVEQATRALPARSGYARHLARAEAAGREWDAWQQDARRLVDRLVAGGAAGGGQGSPRTLSTVSTGALGAGLLGGRLAGTSGGVEHAPRDRAAPCKAAQSC